MLIIGAVFILRGNQNNITLYDIPLCTSQGEYKGGEKNTFSTDYPEEFYWFLGRTGSLESGIYDITVEYYTHQDYYRISCDYGGDGKYYPAVYEEPYTLNALSNRLTYRIWINSKLDNLNIKIYCGSKTGEIFEHESTFYVEKLQIVRNYRMTVFYKALKLLMMLLLLNVALFIFWNRRWCYDKVCENFYVVLGFTCIFMVSSLSVMGNFSVGHHDIPFHYSRIIGVAEGLLNGSFPVKIQPGWLWGYGYAASVCYGDLLLYFPAVLYMFGVPIVHIYKLYILMINFGTLCTAYFCYKKISGSKYVGVTCAALYCLSIVRILNIYLRTAVGEYSAFMFLPLVLLGVWQIYTEEPKSFRSGGLLLCLGMTGIIQTHVITTEMSCIFIALSVLLMIREMSWRIFMALIKSVLTVLCLNIGFLWPLFDYSMDALNVFAEKKSYGIQQLGLSIYELFSFGSTAMGQAKDSLDGLSGRVPESMGLAMLIILLLALVAAVKGREWEPRAKKELALSTVLSGIALWMSTHYFPYNRLAVVPILKKIFASVQFPWRFLSIAVPLLCYMACHVLIKIGQMFGKQKMYYVLIGICLISAFQALYCMDMLNRSEDMKQVYYDYRAERNHSWIASGGEYLLTGTNTYQTGLEQDIFGENIQVGVPERKGTQIRVPCQAEERAWIEFPLFAYKYYQCMDVQTKERFLITRGENNRIHVELPDHYQGTLKVCFVEPWHWRGAEMVSLFTGIWMIVYVWRKRRYRFNIPIS